MAYEPTTFIVDLANVTVAGPASNPEDSNFTGTVSEGQIRTLAWIGFSLHKYFTPVIIVVGLLGNITSLLIFVKTPLRKLSSSVYLAALAVVDTAFLVQIFFSWLSYIRVFVYHTWGVCHVGVYLSYVSSFLSVWFITSFTVERYVAVCYPLRRNNMCTVKRAKIVVLSLTLFALVAYTFAGWTSGIINNTCVPKYENIVKLLNNVDTVITLIIPTLTIFIMNIRIAYTIANFTKRQQNMSAQGQLTSTLAHARQSMMGSEMQPLSLLVADRSSLCSANSATESPVGRQLSFTHRSRTQHRITKLLLVVSTVFLLLNLPSHAIRIYDFFAQILHVEIKYPHIVQNLQLYFTLMYYMNFAVNFFLYSLCGKNFRRALCSLFIKCRGSCDSTRCCSRRQCHQQNGQNWRLYSKRDYQTHDRVDYDVP